MSNDEQQIRELVTKWLAASKAGDTAGVLSLMTDDVVFLTPGQPPMGKAAFAVAAAAQSQPESPRMEATSEIREIEVLGDWAFIWTRLKVVITPATGAPMTRAGHTLSILRKEGGRWLLARDANMLALVDDCGA